MRLVENELEESEFIVKTDNKKNKKQNPRNLLLTKSFFVIICWLLGTIPKCML